MHVLQGYFYLKHKFLNIPEQVINHEALNRELNVIKSRYAFELESLHLDVAIWRLINLFKSDCATEVAIDCGFEQFFKAKPFLVLTIVVIESRAPSQVFKGWSVSGILKHWEIFNTWFFCLSRYHMRETQAAKNLLFRRLRCLANYENANKGLDKARARNKDVQAAEIEQQVTDWLFSLKVL